MHADEGIFQAVCFSRLLRFFSLLMLVTFPPTWATSAESQQQKPIKGAGAHFSWVIFNDLKPELEKLTGRQIKLYGKNSALGLGCNAGIKNARNFSPSRETFGFICCELDAAEISKSQLKVFPLAKEPLLILVNQSNPVDNLKLEQVRKIFRGEIRNWSEVGGNDQAIVVITRLHCKDRPGHWKTILPTASAFRKDRLNVKSADDMVRKVSDFNSAIGHTGSTWSFNSQDRVKTIRVDGYAPSAKNLAKGLYPFYRTLSAVTTQEAKGDVLNLINEVQHGHAFHEVADKYQLLPLNPKRP